MKVPVVLSVEHVAIDADGLLTFDIDGVPRNSGRAELAATFELSSM
jgi:hypothetical protein